MLAFRVAGRRVDFLGINDPTSPTDTPEEFVAVLAATAEAAGVEVPFGKVGALDLGNFTAAQLKMFETLRERLGSKRATQIYSHIVKQTARTWTSSTAYQQYWTGIVRLGDTLGKFTLVPTEADNRHRTVAPGERYFADDWCARNAAADISFGLFWIPYVSDTETSLERLTDAWVEQQRVEIGRVTFPRADPDVHGTKLFALLAAEMGANVANWIDDRGPAGAGPRVPATRFSAARSLAYRESQRGRSALPETLYESVFESGEISPELAAELIRRYRAKRAAGHAAPNLGDIGD
jgi:hypothetical protein